MKKIIFIFMIFLFNTLFCQSDEYEDEILVFDVTINQNLQDYFIEIIIRYTSKIEQGRWDPSTISIISKDLTDTLSSVDQGCWKNFSDKKRNYNFVDINYDGYKDLMVYISSSINGSHHFHDIFIFNPKTNELIWDEDLSESIGVIPR